MTPPVAQDPTLRVPGAHLLLVAGVALVTTIVAGVLQHAFVPVHTDFVYSPISMLLALGTYVIWGSSVLWAASKTGDVRRTLGVVRPPSWPRALGLAAGTVLAALIVSALLEPILHAARQQGLAPDSPRPAGAASLIGVALAFVTIVVVGPVVEELFFRGLLTAGFRRRCGPIGTALLTAALFAIAHFLPRGLPPLFLLGLALALVYERVGSTMPGMMTHCLYNGIALAAALGH
jgi:membrane protease YdiL (CAAX protease family)